MIEQWFDILSRHDFRISRGDIAMKRTNDFLEFSIWESEDVEGAILKNRINLCISIKDRFLEEPQFIGALFAYLKEDGVVLSNHGAGKWWRKNEEELALKALLKFSFLWFDDFGCPHKLIDYFETSLETGVGLNNHTQKNILDKVRHTLSFQKSCNLTTKRRPPIYHYYLSLLYCEIGNRSKACKHATINLNNMLRVNIPGEPERTRRQLEQMGCASQ